MGKLKVKPLSRKKRRAIRKSINSYAISAKDLVKDPMFMLRDPKTGVLIAANSNDFGTQERRSHDVVETEGTGQAHARVVTATQLDTMLSRKNLAFEKEDDHQRLWLAGDQLRRDFDLAQKRPRVISVLSDAPGGKGDVTDKAIAAAKRYQAAIAAVGPILSPVLVHVVCDDQPVSGFGRMRSTQQRAQAATLFKAAIATLAIYYGY